MNLFSKPCSSPGCKKTVLGPRVGGKAKGEWLGYDTCRDCQKQVEKALGKAGLQ